MKSTAPVVTTLAILVCLGSTDACARRYWAGDGWLFGRRSF